MFKQKKTLKIAVISDTHGKDTQLRKLIDNKIKGDIFIHAGDFTVYNTQRSFQNFYNILGEIDFIHKLVIPGNHEIILDPQIKRQQYGSYGVFHLPKQMERQSQIQRLRAKGAIFLQHDFIQIEGIKIFASAYTLIPTFYSSTGFQKNEQDMAKIWQGVPKVDLLVTHGPPFEIKDIGSRGARAGSKTIRSYIEQNEPKMHIFGHVHEDKGQMQLKNTRCINISQKLHLFDFTIDN